jgi:outer membrane biosynthesis protein TonB
MLVLVKKSEKETTPVEVANDAQLEQLIFVWGRANVVDAATGEPFPEPAPPEPVPAAPPEPAETAAADPAPIEQAPHDVELTTEESPATDSGAAQS